MEDNLNLLAPASPELGTAQPQLVPYYCPITKLPHNQTTHLELRKALPELTLGILASFANTTITEH